MLPGHAATQPEYGRAAPKQWARCTFLRPRDPAPRRAIKGRKRGTFGRRNVRVSRPRFPAERCAVAVAMAAGPWGWGLAVLPLLLLAVLRCAARRLRSRSAAESAAVLRDDDVSALLVTAHPDDEVMFFAPTLLCLGRAGARLAVLCCSAGERGCGGATWPLRCRWPWRSGFPPVASRRGRCGVFVRDVSAGLPPWAERAGL